MSHELTLALQSLELEMNQTRKYFMKKIRNIKATLKDAEMHLDPVQQEYEALMQEVD